MRSDQPLRVCLLISRFHPVASGAERQALAQGVELVKRGHQVHVLTRHVPGRPRDEALRGVQVHRWIRPVPVGPLFGLSFVESVVRGLRRLRPAYDLVHTHQALWESIATGLGRDWLRGAPVIVQPASAGHYGEAEEMARTRGFPVLRRLALRNPWFVAISDEIERQWRALGVPADRIVKMASGVDADHFQPGPSQIDDALPSRPRVIFTGRLHPQKNLDVLLDVWPEVHSKTGAALLLVGDGPERSRLEERVAASGLAERVVFTGAVADPAEHLRAASVFALPSVAEGMSNSLLEAMATGLPCLASTIGGNTDLIEHQRTGLLIDPQDRAVWSSTLIRVLQDRALAETLGSAARQRIVAEYALPRVVDRYEALYRRVLES